MAVPQAVAGGKAAQGGGEEPGGEGVTGADGRDDVDPQGGDEDGGTGRVLAALAAAPGGSPFGTDGVLGRLRPAGAPGRGPVEDDGTGLAVLDDQDVGFGQRLADRVRSAQSPGVAGLVVADEDEVGAAREVEQDARSLGVVAPQARAVVDVEGDEGAAGAGAVSSRIRARQPSESAAVMPDRWSTRPERAAARSVFRAVMAEAADPAR